MTINQTRKSLQLDVNEREKKRGNKRKKRKTLLKEKKGPIHQRKK